MRKPSLLLIKTLSNNIKKLRSNMSLSQEELADKCGLHRTYVGAVERGERNVTLSSLCQQRSKTEPLRLFNLAY